MSTHWGYACLSHDPPLTMDEHGGVGGRPSHAFDAMVDALVKHRQGAWPRVEEYEGAGYTVPAPLVGTTGCESAAPLRFLDEHPRCRIAIYNEYGEAWFTDDGILQVSGADPRRSQKPIRDATGRATGEWVNGVYPPEGEFRCTCISTLPAVTHPELCRADGWVRCLTCGGTSLANERVEV